LTKPPSSPIRVLNARSNRAVVSSFAMVRALPAPGQIAHTTDVAGLIVEQVGLAGHGMARQ